MAQLQVRRGFFRQTFRFSGATSYDASITGNDAENRRKTGEKRTKMAAAKLFAHAVMSENSHTGDRVLASNLRRQIRLFAPRGDLFMVETANPEEFSTRQKKKRPEDFEFLKLKLDGGGAELAAFGDMVIATPKARFAQPEISIGVFPPLASTILPYLVGPKKALELVLTGEPVTAERALEMGLINRLVPEADLEKSVNDLVARIAGHSAPVLTMAKKAILSGMGLSLRDGMKQSMSIFLNELYRLEDSQEGLHALVEKRKPNWKNR